MWLADPLSPSGPTVLHLLRPQRSGAVGGLDLHVLELAAAQSDLGMCRSVVVTLGSTAAFRRRARSVGVTVEDAVAWRTHRLLTRHGPDLVHAHGYQADVVA